MLNFRCIRRACLCFLMMAFTTICMAEEWRAFSSNVNETRYQSLVAELRCPKCQNQNLADSNSGIAVDLRNQVHSMIEAGKSDQEIVDYMVARYGEFVLYRPNYSPATYLLWYGPFILLVLGLLTFVLVIMRNNKKRRASSC